MRPLSYPTPLPIRVGHRRSPKVGRLNTLSKRAAAKGSSVVEGLGHEGSALREVCYRFATTPAETTRIHDWESGSKSSVQSGDGSASMSVDCASEQLLISGSSVRFGPIRPRHARRNPGGP